MADWDLLSVNSSSTGKGPNEGIILSPADPELEPPPTTPADESMTSSDPAVAVLRAKAAPSDLNDYHIPGLEPEPSPSTPRDCSPPRGCAYVDIRIPSKKMPKAKAQAKASEPVTTAFWRLDKQPQVTQEPQVTIAPWRLDRQPVPAKTATEPAWTMEQYQVVIDREIRETFWLVGPAAHPAPAAPPTAAASPTAAKRSRSKSVTFTSEVDVEYPPYYGACRDMIACYMAWSVLCLSCVSQLTPVP